MRVIVIASRTWKDSPSVHKRLDDLAGESPLVFLQCGRSGRGADLWVRKWVRAHKDIASVEFFYFGKRNGYDELNASRAAMSRMLDSGVDLALIFRAKGKSGWMDAVSAECRRRAGATEVIRAKPPGRAQVIRSGRK